MYIIFDVCLTRIYIFTSYCLVEDIGQRVCQLVVVSVILACGHPEYILFVWLRMLRCSISDSCVVSIDLWHNIDYDLLHHNSRIDCFSLLSISVLLNKDTSCNVSVKYIVPVFKQTGSAGFVRITDAQPHGSCSCTVLYFTAVSMKWNLFYIQWYGPRHNFPSIPQ